MFPKIEPAQSSANLVTLVTLVILLFFRRLCG